MALKDAQFIKRNVKEYLVEVIQTVRKHVEAESQRDAEALAMEETWHVGVVEQSIGHCEKVSQ